MIMPGSGSTRQLSAPEPYAETLQSPPVYGALSPCDLKADRKGHGVTQPDRFNLKQGHGGIVDIEFLVQYLVLANASKYPELVKWSDNVRQLEALSNTRILEEETALFLKEAYLTFRSRVHRLNLQDNSSEVPKQEFTDQKTRVVEIWEKYFGS